MTSKMTKFLFLFLSGTYLFMHPLLASDENELRIGIIIDGPWKKNVEYISLIKSEILELTGTEFQVSFPEDKQIEGNWNIPRIKTAVSDMLVDPDVDLILTLGVIASHEIATKDKLEKPVSGRNMPFEQIMREKALEAFELWDKSDLKVKY